MPWRGSSDLLQKCGDPLYSYATAEDTNLKFGMLIDLNKYYPENAKLGEIGMHFGSRDLLLNFGTSSIFLK